VLLSARRDADAARRFFAGALRTPKVPREVVTDAAAVYPGVLDELVPSAWHHVEQLSLINLPRHGGGRRSSDRPTG
jgi:IS6 family transposase